MCDRSVCEGGHGKAALLLGNWVKGLDNLVVVGAGG